MNNRAYISGRAPKRYEVYKGRFQVENGPQSYNRCLYGALLKEGGHRFRVFCGDKPELMLYLPGDGGRIFFGCQAGNETFRRLSDCDSVRADYDGVEMRYEIHDQAFSNGTIHMSVVPLARDSGIAIRISTHDMPSPSQLWLAFGGVTVKQDDRAFDAGYTPESKLLFQPESCKGNSIETAGNYFSLSADCLEDSIIKGFVTYGDGFFVTGPDFIIGQRSDVFTDDLPIAGHVGTIDGEGFTGYMVINVDSKLQSGMSAVDVDAKMMYEEAIDHYGHIAERVAVKTPEPIIDAATRTSCTAAEAIWVPPVYVHGAWSWDIPIMGWRSMYGPSCYGWHDRVQAEARFFTDLQLYEEGSAKPKKAASDSAQNIVRSAYFKREEATLEEGMPLGAPDPDPDFLWARQSSRSLFVSPGMMPYLPWAGRKVIYDMQEVFIDQILYEFEWTGNLAFAKMMFPALIRHLEWERRCFDADGDGLYENYANFWASDSIFASGAGCSLASSYNYRAYRIAAEMAEAIGENPEPLREKAEQIHTAVQRELWLSETGHIAECKDAYGEKLIHPMPSLPTIVHTVESGILDEFQMYQTLSYTKHGLERLSVDGANGELIWNTNWAPYQWSVRDIAYADVLHASLCYFKLGRTEEAYRLLIGVVTDSTCNHIAPGGFMCVYEGKSVDFADTVSLYGRTLVEGLFGISPRMHIRKMLIAPGFPEEWTNASIRTPDIEYVYNFDRSKSLESLHVISTEPSFKEIRLRARKAEIRQVRCNGVILSHWVEPGIGHSYVIAVCPEGREHYVEIDYGTQMLHTLKAPSTAAIGEKISIGHSGLNLRKIYDPQRVFENSEIREDGGMEGNIGIGSTLGNKTVFLLIENTELTYWWPLDVEIRKPIDFIITSWEVKERRYKTQVRNNTARNISIEVRHGKEVHRLELIGYECTPPLSYNMDEGTKLTPGANVLKMIVTGDMEAVYNLEFTDWSIGLTDPGFVTVSLADFFNDHAGSLFHQEFVSPRSPYCSLQVPLHLVPSNWCVTGTEGLATVNDLHLRSCVNEQGIFQTDAGIPFLQVSEKEASNAVFVSQWDNYPTEIEIPVQAQGEKLYIMLTGYTNQMQCGVKNGSIEVVYEDGSISELILTAPTNFRSMEKGPESERACDSWCYGKTPLIRVPLGYAHDSALWQDNSDSFGKQEEASWNNKSESAVHQIYGQILDVFLEWKPIRAVRMKATANDVVIGMLGITVL